MEIAAVGFSPVNYGLDKPQSWLQVAYLALGAVIAFLGAGLWRAVGGRRLSIGTSRQARQPGLD